MAADEFSAALDEYEYEKDPSGEVLRAAPDLRDQAAAPRVHAKGHLHLDPAHRIGEGNPARRTDTGTTMRAPREQSARPPPDRAIKMRK